MPSKPPFRADHVGSFLRPKALIDARDAFAAGTIDAAALRAVEASAIRDVVAFQEGLGIQAITDGEFRRKFFHTDFLLPLDGIDEQGGISRRPRWSSPARSAMPTPSSARTMSFSPAW